MEFPSEVKWQLPIVVGESWPEGDEDKLRELRDQRGHPSGYLSAGALGVIVHQLLRGASLLAEFGPNPPHGEDWYAAYQPG